MQQQTRDKAWIVSWSALAEAGLVLTPDNANSSPELSEFQVQARDLCLGYLARLCRLLAHASPVYATACVMWYRFFLKNDFRRYDARRVALACVLLAGKSHECPRRVRSCLNVAAFLDNPDASLSIGDELLARRDDLTYLELVVLRDLVFDTDIPVPYYYLLNLGRLFIRSAPSSSSARRWYATAALAWRLTNEAMTSVACVTAPPLQIAAASLLLACLLRQHRLPYTSDGALWHVLGLDADAVAATADIILSACLHGTG